MTGINDSTNKIEVLRLIVLYLTKKLFISFVFDKKIIYLKKMLTCETTGKT